MVKWESFKLKYFSITWMIFSQHESLIYRAGLSMLRNIENKTILSFIYFLSLKDNDPFCIKPIKLVANLYYQY